MSEPPSNVLADQIRAARERLTAELNSHAEKIDKLLEDGANLRQQHQQVAREAEQQWEALARAEASLPRVSPDTVLENVLAAVRNLITCTLPQQVLHVLTEEALGWGVRAAVFDVRGKAAWGAAAKGFGPELADETFRAVVVPLSPGGPFRQVCDIADHVDTNAGALKKHRSVLEKLKPSADDPILLLPIRSAGAVTAILYADPGGKRDPLPVNALKILAEFAGAQLDRLMGLSGETLGDAATEGAEVAEAVEEVTEPAAEEATSEPAAPQDAEPAGGDGETPTQAEQPPEIATPAGLVSTELTPAPQPPDTAPGSDFLALSEAEQKLHKDAKRFAKLLVSEIELYNKGKVADGRQNKDLYARLKADIDRSRQTFDKRFGKVLGKETDHFHEELVRILAANDSSLLGPDYPGPAA